MEVRREEILSTTVELFDKLGLGATRVADVALALDVSPALVFYHFGTKDDLVAEAFAHAVERDLQPDGEGGGRRRPGGRRCGGCCKLYGPTGRATGWRIWIDAWAVGQREPGIRKLLQRLDHRWQDILRGVVDDGVASGVFTCPDPEASVARLSALVDGLSVAVVVNRSVTREQLRNWVAAQLAVELGVDVATWLTGPPDRRPVTTLPGLSRHRDHLTPASGLRSRAGSAPAGRGRTPTRRSSSRRSVARSASTRPNVGTNLNACAAPSPTTTRSWPGTGAITKSRSGVSVYWQRTDRSGAPTPGSSVAQVLGQQRLHLGVRVAGAVVRGRPSGRRSPGRP